MQQFENRTSGLSTTDGYFSREYVILRSNKEKEIFLQLYRVHTKQRPSAGLRYVNAGPCQIQGCCSFADSVLSIQ